MSTLLTTLVIAFVIVVLACGLLGIGLLLTGKSKIKAGACGKDPTKKQDESEECGTSRCSLCEDPHKTPAKKSNRDE